MTDLDLREFKALSFDCYGTLIDWERGILDGLRGALGDPVARIPDDALLEAYARHEAGLERGPYRRYREVLEGAARGVAAELGASPDERALAAFANSVGKWPPFPDSVEALARLRDRFRLGVITNCDDDLFERSADRLGQPFTWVVTAQQVAAYKPSTAGFERAFSLIGRPRERILHVAQSLYHDHVPAQALGLATAWIDRRHDRPGFGATPAASAKPDVTAPDLASLARLVLA